jgi:hypothetical protein
MKPRRAPPILIAATILCGGCALTPAPLKTDHGYPADWPQLIALSKGLTELNGIYVNQGVATTGDGKLVPMALADLVPKTMPRKGASAETDPGCEDCVALRVLPPKGEFLSAPKLRFTLPPSPDPRVFDVPVSGNAGATLYVLQNFGQSVNVGMGVTAPNVTLTCAKDGSLVAQIHSVNSLLLLMVIPIITEDEYIWARFERIGELSRRLATDAAPPTSR